ncbi:MAG: hypothetical protein SOT68_12205, partial [Oscillospiraceae bacterium]|nr:hypothetical protein [Oscillospiraceae bacterium]
TVEVPEADKEHILDSMAGTKINGQKITVKPYEGRAERFEDDRHSHRQKNSHRGANTRGKGGRRGNPGACPRS